MYSFLVYVAIDKRNTIAHSWELSQVTAGNKRSFHGLQILCFGQYPVKSEEVANIEKKKTKCEYCLKIQHAADQNTHSNYMHMYLL